MPDLPIPPISDLLELLPPAGAALAVVLIGAWLGRRGHAGLFASASVLAIFVAYAWTFVRARESLSFPPRDSTERGFYAILAATVLGMILSYKRLEFFRRFGLQILAALVAVLFVPGGVGSTAIKLFPLAAVGVGAIVYFVLLDFGSFSPTPVFCACSTVALGATSELLLMFHGALLAQLAGAMAITMGLIGVGSLLFRQHLPAAMAMPLAAVVTVLSFDSALYMYEPPPLIALGLLAAAPIVPVIIYAASANRLGPRKAMMAGILLSLAITGLGFFLGWRVAPESYG